MSVWDLIKAQKFAEACTEADAEFTRNGDIFSLRNKVFALLQLKRFDEAASVAQRIIDMTEGSTDADFIFLGVARWLNHDSSGAINAWQAGTHSKYADAAGGVEIPMLLLFAASKVDDAALRKQALETLQKSVSAESIVNWPGPIAKYLVGLSSERELMHAIDSQSTLHEKQKCQAEFYLGVKCFNNRDQTGFRNNMKLCADHDIVSVVKPEFHLARGECKNFGSC